MKKFNAMLTPLIGSTYDAFGSATVGAGYTLTNNLRLPGQYYDAETGLHNNWMRYYDPGTGRYVTSDPIGLVGGMNLYGYAYGSPLTYIDPYGLFCLSQKFIKITAATIGGSVTGGLSGGPWGILYGGAAGLISESLVQYNPLLNEAGGKTTIGMVAGYYAAGRGNSARAMAIGAISGAYGGLVQSQTTEDGSNAAAGGFGGAIGGIIGELVVPQSRYTGNSGALLFGPLKGGFYGFVGGFVQDAIEAGLDQFLCKGGEYCGKKY